MWGSSSRLRLAIPRDAPLVPTAYRWGNQVTDPKWSGDVYWDLVVKHANALGVDDSWSSPTAGEHLGYGTDVHNTGGCDRGTDSDVRSATHAQDQGPGRLEFVRWDEATP